MLHTGGNNGRKELHTIMSYIWGELCAGKSYISTRGDMHWEGLCTGKNYALRGLYIGRSYIWKETRIKGSYTLLIERSYTNKLQKSE